MKNRENENRPIKNDEAVSAPFAIGDSILPDLPDAVDILNGVFVVLVAHKVNGEVRYRRRIYLTLEAAEKAEARNVMAGRTCSVTLCRLDPMHTMNGGWSK